MARIRLKVLLLRISSGGGIKTRVSDIEKKTEGLTLNEGSSITIRSGILDVNNAPNAALTLACDNTSTLWVGGENGGRIHLPFSFGIDENNNYGYKKAGADTVIPFLTGFSINTPDASYAVNVTKNATVAYSLRAKTGEKVTLYSTASDVNSLFVILSNGAQKHPVYIDPNTDNNVKKLEGIFGVPFYPYDLTEVGGGYGYASTISGTDVKPFSLILYNDTNVWCTL